MVIKYAVILAKTFGEGIYKYRLDILLSYVGSASEVKVTMDHATGLMQVFIARLSAKINGQFFFIKMAKCHLHVHEIYSGLLVRLQEMILFIKKDKKLLLVHQRATGS